MALTVGRELFIITRISYSKLKSHACVLYHGVKRRRLISTHKRQYEDPAGSGAEASASRGQQSRDTFEFIYKILFHFI